MKWVLIALIGLLPLVIYTLPDFTSYAATDVGMFYHYGVNESNYVDEYDTINNRVNAIPNFDVLILYAPRIQEIAQGKLASDPYLKEYSNQWSFEQDLIPLYFYGIIAKIIGISWTNALNIIVTGCGVFLLLFFGIRQFIKDEIIAALIAATPLFSFRWLSLLFKHVSNSHILPFLTAYDFVPNGQIVRMPSLSFPLIVLFLSLLLLPRLLEGKDENWKQALIMLLLITNCYIYFYSWTLLGVVLGLLSVYLFITNHKVKWRATIVLILYTLGALPQIINLLLQRTSGEIMYYYGLYTANIGDALNLFWLLALTFITYHFLQKSVKKTLPAMVAGAAIVATALIANIDLILEYPQPDHYLHFFRLLFVAALLVALYNWSQKKWIIIAVYSMVLIPIVLFTALTITLEQPPTTDTVERSDLELFAYLNEHAIDKNVATLALYPNMLIPIYTQSYVFLPNILYSKANLEESMSRYIALTQAHGMTNSEAYEHLKQQKGLYSILLHRLENDKILHEVIDNASGEFKIDYMLITPIERDYGWSGGELVFENTLYSLYLVNSTLQTTMPQ